MKMGKMIFVICRCGSFNILSMNQKEIEKSLEDSGSFGFIKSDNSNFQYMRRSECAICASNVYFKLGYSKKSIYDYGTRIVANELREKIKSQT